MPGVAIAQDTLPKDSSLSQRLQLGACFYPTELIEYATKNKVELLKIEKKLLDLINDGNEFLLIFLFLFLLLLLVVVVVVVVVVV